MIPQQPGTVCRLANQVIAFSGPENVGFCPGCGGRARFRHAQPGQVTILTHTVPPAR